ncbi:interleukin-31 receptor subunit alpha [Brienomyrus brachyistius]|uniref:interleukin-31 receptor subunit alpha n=1 Tax=Brienomyrus brachyistius TaxID=42636 RepID=UPI0020B2EECE|nr:interleukin-31 receptor subunit alpha [Brienomyrus brachyistius]
MYGPDLDYSLCLFTFLTSVSGVISHASCGGKARNSQLECTLHVNDLKQCSASEHLNQCFGDNGECDFPLLSGQGFLFSEAVKNISCYVYPEKSVTCSWMHNQRGILKYSLLISSSENLDCKLAFNTLGQFNVTIIAWNTRNQRVTLSHPFLVKTLERAMSPKPVDISITSITNDSISVKWNPAQCFAVRCMVYYRPVSSDHWKEVLHPGCKTICSQEINGLQPFTEYCVKVACATIGSKLWGPPSNNRTAKTLEIAPRHSVDVCQRVDTGRPDRLRKVWLMWKALEESHGSILGYWVNYTNQTKSVTVKTTDLKISFDAREEEYDIIVTAYNSAGVSPVSRLRLPSADNDIISDAPPVLGIWATTQGSTALVEWEMGETERAVSEFAIEWVASQDASSSRWLRVQPNFSSAVLHGNLHPSTTYNISIYPIYGDICGPPKSVPASLESGVIGGAGRWDITQVRKNSVTLNLKGYPAGQGNSLPKYNMTLTSKNGAQNFLVTSANQTFTIRHLTANTDYFLKVLAGASPSQLTSESFTTPLYDTEDILYAILPPTFLILLVLVLLTHYRTVYMGYLCPLIPNPSCSSIRQWGSLSAPEVTPKLLDLELLSTVELPAENFSIQVMPSEPPVITEAMEEDPDYIENYTPNFWDMFFKKTDVS